MGLIYAELELINAGDIELARRHYIGEEEIKRMKVTAVVDNSAYMFCINETVQEQLDLPLLEMRKGVNANGEVREYKVVGPIEVCFKNRKTICQASVLSEDGIVTLGKTLLLALDVIIEHDTLIVNPKYPDMAYSRI